jgi:hypothetical protein
MGTSQPGPKVVNPAKTNFIFGQPALFFMLSEGRHREIALFVRPLSVMIDWFWYL